MIKDKIPIISDKTLYIESLQKHHSDMNTFSIFFIVVSVTMFALGLYLGSHYINQQENGIYFQCDDTIGNICHYSISRNGTQIDAYMTKFATLKIVTGD
jgi:hypothetical protein